MNFIDPEGLFVPPSLPQWFVDGVTGFGDGVFGAITFGIGDLQGIRDFMDIDGGVDPCSGWYSGGTYAGYGWSLGLGAAGTARELGWAVSFDHYKNAGGVGINFMKDGMRKLGLDWHKFKVNGQTVNRPHYHKGDTKSQMKKHRPWQGN